LRDFSPLWSDGWRGLLVLAAIHLGFFWKITLSDQFSFLIHWDNANQVFPWTQFAVHSLANANLPFWDPHAFAGKSFVGEMQTGLFNPLHLPLYIAGWLAGGAVEPHWIDWFVVGCHLLGCWFLYLLALRLRLSRSAALVAACVFGLGGFVGNLPWPGMLSSSIWLPLIVWASIESLTSAELRRRLVYGSLAGLGFGMTALAGGMQILLADALLIVALCLYWRAYHRTSREPRLAALLRGVACAVGIGMVGALAGAAQLLPSLEYGGDTLRWVGAPDPLPSLGTIPYHLLSSEAALPPRAMLNLLFGGAPVGTSEIAPYFGILPLLLAVLAVRRRWRETLVPLLTVCGGLSLFYALGGYSLLHGLVYGVLPLVDKAREAGRFLYLTHFCAALLAGYGSDAVFGLSDKPDGLEKTVHYLNLSLFVLALAAACAFILHIDIADTTYLSLIFAGASVAILNGRRFLARSGAGAAIITAVLVCDLYAFYVPIRNEQRESAAGTNLLQRVEQAGALAEFFHAQPGVFRVSIEDQLIRGMGDLYSLDTVNAGAVTVGRAFYRVVTQVPRRLDLLNVRYTVTTRERAGKAAAFAAHPWFVYEHPSPCQRAWIAREVTEVSSLDAACERMRAPSFEPCRQVTVLASHAESVSPAELPAASRPEDADRVEVHSRSPGYYELDADTAAVGLLVLSENYAPGWTVAVNGTPRQLLQVDGTLQGVWLDAGMSRVVFEYRPSVLYLGVALTSATFVGVGVGLVWFRPRRFANRAGNGT
jgi:Bacterial membrane protein YfhO